MLYEGVLLIRSVLLVPRVYRNSLILRKVGLLSGENIEKIIRSYRDPVPLFTSLVSTVMCFKVFAQ